MVSQVLSNPAASCYKMFASNPHENKGPVFSSLSPHFDRVLQSNSFSSWFRRIVHGTCHNLHIPQIIRADIPDQRMGKR